VYTFLVQLLYLRKLSRPKIAVKIKIKSWKFHRKMRFWLKISICQRGMAHEGCWVNFPTGVPNLDASIDCRREAIRRVQLSGNQAAADRVRHVAKEDPLLSQEDKPKRNRLVHAILRETGIPCSSVHKTIHRDLQLKCFKWRRAQLLPEANCVARLTPW